MRVFHKLNARFCDSVAAPGRYLDGDGLHLEVTESRSKTRPPGSVNKAWVKYFAIDGSADSMGIGPYRLVPLVRGAEAQLRGQSPAGAGYQPARPPRRDPHGGPRRRIAHRDLWALPRRLPRQPRRPLAHQTRQAMAQQHADLLQAAVRRRGG